MKSETNCVVIDVSLNETPMGYIKIPVAVPSGRMAKLIGKPLTDWETEAIIATYLYCGCNLAKTAMTLLIPERTLYRRIDSLQIDLNQIKADFRLHRRIKKARKEKR